LQSPFNDVEYTRALNLSVVMSDEGETYGNRVLIQEWVDQTRVPAVYPYREMTEAGGLMSYSWDMRSVARSHAMLIAKILGGANPGDLPYIQQARFELVINLKTRRLGSKFRPNWSQVRTR